MRSLTLLMLTVAMAIATQAQQSQNVKLLCNWNDTSNIRINFNGARYSDVWGFTWNGTEYAAMGSTEGVHIIDIEQCTQVAFYPGRASGPTIVHRDYKTYKHYLYAVCDEGFSSLQVFDLQYLPDSLHLVFESSPVDLMLSHNLFIDTTKGKLYAASVRSLTGMDNMRVYSLKDPEKPLLTDKYNRTENVHDVYVRNDTAWCSASFYGMEVVDFSIPGNYRVLGELKYYPYKGYNHSSWIGLNGIGVMADETHGMPVKVIDSRDVKNIDVLSTFSPRPDDTTCIPHNPFLVGNYAFVAYYLDGLQIYDISDPLNPKRTGFYDTYPGADYKGFAGAWGCYPFLPSKKILVCDMQTGLYVLDVMEATGWDKINTDFHIYPNPAKDILYLSFPSDAVTGEVAIRIFDIAGKTLFDGAFDPKKYIYQAIQLPLPGYWPAGVYIISVTAGDQKFTSKFTKL